MMRSALRHRPSASMIVALVALVVAMSGSAVAASRLVNGDKLIRKRTLSGNRLRKHTLTGSQINLKKLGTVPKARSAASAGHATSADTAGHATSADTAGHATSADSATNAVSLGGRPASGFLTTANRIGTNGVVKTQGTPGGHTVTLFSHGPFTVTMTCTTASNGDTTMSIDGTSTEDNSVMDRDTGVTSDNLDGFNLSSANPQTSGGTYTMEAPSGAGIVFAGSFGTNSDGVSNGCWANFAGTA